MKISNTWVKISTTAGRGVQLQKHGISNVQVAYSVNEPTTESVFVVRDSEKKLFEDNTDLDFIWAKTVHGTASIMVEEAPSRGLSTGESEFMSHWEYNEAEDRLVADKAIETTLNSLYLGEQHKMSSGSENIYFTNLSSDINWFPMWGGLKDQSIVENRGPSGFIPPSGRVYTDMISLPLGGSPQPATSVGYAGDNYFAVNISGVGITTVAAEAVPEDINLDYRITIDNKVVYSQRLPRNAARSTAGLTISEGDVIEWFFDHPVDVKIGTTLFAEIHKVNSFGEDLGVFQVQAGDTVDPNTGLVRYQATVHNRLFEDKDLELISPYLKYQEMDFGLGARGLSVLFRDLSLGDAGFLAPHAVNTLEAVINGSDIKIKLKEGSKILLDAIPVSGVTIEGIPSDTDVSLAVDQLNDLFTNEQALGGGASVVVLSASDTVDVTRDATNTTILFNDGAAHAVNSLRATLAADGTITIQTKGDTPTDLYLGLFHTNVKVGGALQSGSVLAIVNILNALFDVTPLGLGGTDPEPEFPTLAGEDITESTLNAIDPVGDNIVGVDGTGWAWYTATENINEIGEYYTVKVTGHGRWIIGLASEADGDFAEFDISKLTNAHAGLKWSQAFYDYGTYMGAWTLYGSSPGYVAGPGWSDATLGFRYQTDIQDDVAAGDAALMKVGIDSMGYASVWYWRTATNEWVMVGRSNYILPADNYKLLVKLYGGQAQICETAKRVAVDAAAPTLYERWIESPDGTFIYPLYASEEEAEYVDGENGGGGTAVTRTYVDDASNTTWYLPNTGATENGTSAPATGTEIVTLADGAFAPPAFSASTVSVTEGTSVNIQITPAGAVWSTSVDVSPAGSGLVFDGFSLLQGTLADVGADTDYTVTVTRANAYGSTVGTMTVTATDTYVPPASDTAYTKAIDFSGSSERLQQVVSSPTYNPLALGGQGHTVGAAPVGDTATSGFARPWATTIVFRHDGNNSNQHIWNYGEGAGNNDDNIYVRLDANGSCYFGWGRGSNANECNIGYLAANKWYGLYVGHTGARFNAAESTSANLAAAFDIRLMYQNDLFTQAFQHSTVAKWNAGTTGDRMDRAIVGDMTIGGRGGNRNFHGKVASMVVTTLERSSAMPSEQEILCMITDPEKWMDDYKVGTAWRPANQNYNNPNWSRNDNSSSASTQVWLMGDGGSDAYATIRNAAHPANQNYTTVNMISMSSNDIVNVTIPGLG